MCIKRLSTAPELSERLRELGFCEEQQIKLVARDATFICQVCNARLAISQKLADSIFVEAVAGPLRARNFPAEQPARTTGSVISPSEGDSSRD